MKDHCIGDSTAEARKQLEKGLLVAIPTETVYGLAANALDTEAVLRIFEAKNRPAFDPLIVHLPAADRLPLYAEDIPEAARLLAGSFWPGPLTLLLPKKPVIPDIVTSGLDTVALRVPDHPLTLRLLESLDFPLAAPSANPFGYVSPTKASHVRDQLHDKVAYILDGGECRVGLESTIVGFPENGQPVVYRLGGLTIENIEGCIGPVHISPHSTSNPKAPGMLQSHYAPRKPVSLGLPGSTLPADAGYLLFSTALPGISSSNQRILSPEGSLHEAARNLFAQLRELDQAAVSRIYAEQVPDEGLGKAINDRLRRAAALPH